MIRHMFTVLAVMLVGAVTIEFGGHLVASGQSLVTTAAEAKVGRPLTPVSVAGAARRTTRRCAAGVYNC